MSFNLITILGPTAVGKTRLAALLADNFKGEIISADSRQVYRGMNIGTGKDLEDYVIRDRVVPYHLIDIADPGEEYNLFRFSVDFREAFREITGRKKLPILAGGTGLYLSSVLQDYELPEVEFSEAETGRLEKLDDDELRELLKKINPSLHNTTDLLDRKRIITAIIISGRHNSTVSPAPLIIPLILGIALPRLEIKERITARLKSRLQNGMVEEVEKLLESGVSFEKLEFFGLEYKFIGRYLGGTISYNDMFQKLNSAIHKFAKRQMTWFRKMEKEGLKINWIDGPDFESAKEIIENNRHK